MYIYGHCVPDTVRRVQVYDPLSVPDPVRMYIRGHSVEDPVHVDRHAFPDEIHTYKRHEVTTTESLPSCAYLPSLEHISMRYTLHIALYRKYTSL
jgi:hypothetical protein